VHRLSVFTPRALDVDVVLDLMIHDLDIVLASCTRRSRNPRVGLPILSDKVDIANVRVESNRAAWQLTAAAFPNQRVRNCASFGKNRQPHGADFLDRECTKASTISRSWIIKSSTTSTSSARGVNTLSRCNFEKHRLRNERQRGTHSGIEALQVSNLGHSLVLFRQEKHFVRFGLRGGERFFDEQSTPACINLRATSRCSTVGTATDAACTSLWVVKHLLDRSEGFAVKFAGSRIGARGIGIDHSTSRTRPACSSWR